MFWNILKILLQNIRKRRPLPIRLPIALTRKLSRPPAPSEARFFLSISAEGLAVLIDRDVCSVLAFFGIVFSGNFYVPVDPKLPAERIRQILKTLDPFCILGSEKQLSALTSSLRETGNYPLLSIETALQTEPDEAALEKIRKTWTQILSIRSLLPAPPVFPKGSSSPTALSSTWWNSLQWLSTSKVKKCLPVRLPLTLMYL